MEEEIGVFKWVVGIITILGTAIAGLFKLLESKNKRMIADLQKRTKKLEEDAELLRGQVHECEEERTKLLVKLARIEGCKVQDKRGAGD